MAEALSSCFVILCMLSSGVPDELSKLDRALLSGRGLEVREGPPLEEGRLARLPVVLDPATARARRSCRRSFLRALEELRETARELVSYIKPLQSKADEDAIHPAAGFAAEAPP